MKARSSKIERRARWRDDVGQVAAKNFLSVAGRIEYDYAELTVNFTQTARYPEEPLGSPNQLNHWWMNHSVARPHIHWFQASSATPNLMIAWRLVRNGHAVPAVWTTAKYTSSLFTYTSGTMMQITQFPEIDCSTLSWSDDIDIKLYRDNTNASGLFAGADPVAATVRLKFFDLHLPVEHDGTVFEYTGT